MPLRLRSGSCYYDSAHMTEEGTCYRKRVFREPSLPTLYDLLLGIKDKQRATLLSPFSVTSAAKDCNGGVLIKTIVHIVPQIALSD